MQIASESGRLLIILIALALSLCARGATQKSEPTNELPEDCSQDQFFNQLELRCQNCSGVMQLFETATSNNNRPLQAPIGNQNNDATLILIGEQSKQRKSSADQKAQQFMRLSQRLPQLNGNKSRSSAPAPESASSSTANLARARPSASAAAASDAVLSRFVMKSAASANNWEAPGEMAANNDDERDSLMMGDDASAGPIDPLANTELDEAATARRGAIRSAKVWHKLLARFVQSSEFGQIGLPDSIRQCKQMQNLSACQMWSNVCVLTMYAHTSDSSIGSRRGGGSSSSSGSPPASQLRTSPLASRQGSELRELATSLRMSWQKCARFAPSSACNSLRDWHLFDKQQLELNDIFADERETAPLAGDPVAKPGPLSLVLQLNQPIQLLAYKYSLNGQLLEVNQFNLNDLRRSFCVGASGNKLSLDNKLKFTDNLNLFLDNNFLSLDGHQDQDELLGQLRVGQNVQLNCKFSPLEANLLAPAHLNETQFVDLFIAQPAPSGAMSLRPVPVLIENLLFNQQLVNLRFAQDPSRWKLVHRFFSQATMKLATRNALDFEDEVLVYAKGLDLELSFKRQHDNALALSSIVLRLHYDFLPLVRSTLRRRLQLQALSSNESGTFATELNSDDSFRKRSHESRVEVSQSLVEMLMYKKDFDLLLTILCLISCIWSLIKTYNVQKFQGFIKLDIYSLFLFLIISCDIVANLMLAVTLLFGLHLFVILKLHPLVMSISQLPVFAPSGELESTLLTNLQLALVFKCIGLAYKLFIRLRSDTFFIDWERPKMLTSTQLMNHQTASRAGADSKSTPNQMHHQQQRQQQQQVSFWRQYAIVNRWLQMQTMRRLDLTMQLLLFVFALQCFKLDQLATADASLHLDGTVSQQSLTFRAVVMALVYLALATAQLAYRKFLHEPMIRSQTREFTDLCSVSNVSLISLLYPRFGYYIHGRNANGSSECGIAEMNALLEREERDLCSKRGLVPNTDQQTFVLLLPKIINDHYRKLLFRTSESSGFGNGAAGFLSAAPSALDGFQLKSALNLSSLAGASAASPLSPTARSSNQRHSLIESIVARNRAVNVFLINYLEHVYKDIDYSIRERKRFETACLLDAELDAADDEEAPAASLGNKLMGPRAAEQLAGAGPLANLNRRRAGGLLVANQAESGAQQARARGVFFVDYRDSFTALLWLGLEWDLVVMELLALLNLDLWLGRANLILTVGLLWLINRFFRMIYVACARSNLIIKAMLDEKFLIR